MTANNQEANPENTLYHLSYLGVIDITGDDAAQFLQGQLTCNVKELTESKSSLAAFCSPKGRVIATLLVVKTQFGFLLVLPQSLLDTVLRKLQIYVLRAKVKLTDKSRILTLIGLCCANSCDEVNLPSSDFHCCNTAGRIYIKLPAKQRRFLCISDSAEGHEIAFENCAVGDESVWRYQDISSGFPWFDIDQTEKHLPQTLNIDQLGGVSFNKGCYTGQEIVARTHYLGKAKRQLFLGECKGISQSDRSIAVKDAETRENVGEILARQTVADSTRMLLVLQTVDGMAKNLILDDTEQTPLALISCQ